MAKPTKGRNGFITIKIPMIVYTRIEMVMKRVRLQGWRSIKATRTDAPTIGSVVDEALARLDPSR